MGFHMMYNQNSIIATVNSIAAISVIIIIIIIIISFIYMSGYFSLQANQENNKTKHRNMMLLKDDKYSGVS